MLCSNCLDKGKEVDMEHVKGVRDYHNPADQHGHGQDVVCGFICNSCGAADDCDGSCKEPPELES